MKIVIQNIENVIRYPVYDDESQLNRLLKTDWNLNTEQSTS